MLIIPPPQTPRRRTQVIIENAPALPDLVETLLADNPRALWITPGTPGSVPGSTTIWLDATDNHLDMTGTGLTYGGTGPWPRKPVVPGQFRSGSHSNLSVPFGELVYRKTTPWTIELWMRYVPAFPWSPYTGIIGKMMSSNIGWSIMMGGAADGTTNHVLVNLNNSSSHRLQWEIATQQMSPVIDLTDGMWHDLGISYDGSVTAAGLSAVVDGRLAPIRNLYATLTTQEINNSLRAGIGNSGQGRADYWSGDLAMVAAYPQVLTVAQLQKHHQIAVE